MFGCGRRLEYRDVGEENVLLEQLNKRKLVKYGHWKRRNEGLDMAVTEGEIEGKWSPCRIDNVRRWTVGGYRLPGEQRLICYDRRGQKTETRNIVVRCLRPYKGYDLL